MALKALATLHVALKPGDKDNPTLTGEIAAGSVFDPAEHGIGPAEAKRLIARGHAEEADEKPNATVRPHIVGYEDEDTPVRQAPKVADREPPKPADNRASSRG